jgi:hypothetical protein
VKEWIVGLEDVTPLAHAIRDAVRSKKALPVVPEEKVYPIDEELERRPGIRELSQS